MKSFSSGHNTALPRHRAILCFISQEYTPKQVTSLVMCGVGAHLNRKARQKLLAVISSDDTNK